MLKTSHWLFILAGLIYAATTARAHGPIPVPLQVVDQQLENNDNGLQNHDPFFSFTTEMANKILASETEADTKKVYALIFLANQQESSAVNWYDHYRDHTDNLSLRYATLYLGAMLGRPETRDAIIDMLKHRPDKGKAHFAEEERLLRGLIELTTADEFSQIVAGIFNEKHFFPFKALKRLTLQAKLYKGNADQKAEAAVSILALWNEEPRLCEESLIYMTSRNNALPYLKQWRLRDPVLVFYLNKLGYTIQTSGKHLNFVKVGTTSVNIPTKPDKLAEDIIKSLAGNDQNAFRQLLIKPEQYQLVNSLYKGAMLGMDDDTNKRNKVILSSWENLRKIAIKRGVDLNRARFKSAEYAVLVVIGGVQFTHVDITFETVNSDQHLRLEHSLQVDGQWYVTGALRWQ